MLVLRPAETVAHVVLPTTTVSLALKLILHYDWDRELAAVKRAK